MSVPVDSLFHLLVCVHDVRGRNLKKTVNHFIVHYTPPLVLRIHTLLPSLSRDHSACSMGALHDYEEFSLKLYGEN